MENNTYTQVKEWFKQRDFSFDYYIEFEKQEYHISLLRIRKIDYDWVNRKYIETIFPIKLFLYEIYLDNNKINCFLNRDMIKSISIEIKDKIFLEISFYNNPNILKVNTQDLFFLEPYQSPYIPPFRIQKDKITAKFQKNTFDIKYIFNEFKKKQIEVTLNGYFGEEVFLPNDTDIDFLFGLSILQKYPKGYDSHEILDINIYNIEERDFYVYISFDLQNTEMNLFWFSFLEIIMSYNVILEIKSGNIIYSKENFYLFKKDFGIK